jgi:FOG: WD40 repeat
LEKTQETTLQGHTGCVTTLAVTSDYKYIVSGSDDYTIRIWNVLEKTQETVFCGHKSAVITLLLTF